MWILVNFVPRRSSISECVLKNGFLHFSETRQFLCVKIVIRFWPLLIDLDLFQRGPFRTRYSRMSSLVPSTPIYALMDVPFWFKKLNRISPNINKISINRLKNVFFWYIFFYRINSNRRWVKSHEVMTSIKYEYTNASCDRISHEDDWRKCAQCTRIKILWYTDDEHVQNEKIFASYSCDPVVNRPSNRHNCKN